MGWLRSVGSLKLYVSFAEYSLFYRALLQKETYNFKEPTNRSYPIADLATSRLLSIWRITNYCKLRPSQQHTATHCNTLQRTATHCNTLTVVIATHTATHCNTQHSLPVVIVAGPERHCHHHCNTLQHTATHCNTLHHTRLSRITTCCNCNTLHRTATYNTFYVL